MSGLLATYLVAFGAMTFCALTILTFVRVLGEMDRADQEGLAAAAAAGISQNAAEKSAQEHAVA